MIVAQEQKDGRILLCQIQKFITKDYFNQRKKEDSVNKWYDKTDCLFGGKIIIESY